MVFNTDSPIFTSENVSNQIESFLKTHYPNIHLKRLSNNSYCFLADSNSDTPVLLITEYYICLPDEGPSSYSMLDIVDSLQEDINLSPTGEKILSYLRSIHQNSKLL